jgi:hypothetical protein
VRTHRFDPGPIDGSRSDSDSGEGNLRVFGRAVNTVAKRQPIRRSREAPQGCSAEQAINPFFPSAWNSQESRSSLALMLFGPFVKL